MSPIKTLILSAALIATSSAAIVAGLPEPTGSVRTDSYPGAGFGFFTPSGTGTTINRLGFWDQGGDGLLTDHTVAIYGYNGSGYDQVAIATIPAGTTATLDGGYRWVNIAPVNLPDIGQNADYYLILATQGQDPWTNGLGVTMNASIGAEANKALIFDTSTLQAPVFSVAGGSPAISNGYGGANLGFESVPEPSALLLSAFFALAFCHRRRSI